MSDFDKLLLQSLMGRLQLRPPYLGTNSFLSQSLDDFLLDESPSDYLSDLDEASGAGERSALAKEEAKLEQEIIRIILSGRTDSLKPNSGQAVAIGDHHICVGSHVEDGSGYRVWEWHGHIMLFDEENGYTPEYIYGNYFERVPVKDGAAAASNGGRNVRKKDAEEEEEKGSAGTQGLRELIGGAGSINGRILQRSLNAGSPR